MSGSARLSPSRNRKQEGSTLSAFARNLRKECAGLVAGRAVLTDKKRTADIYSPFQLYRPYAPAFAPAKAFSLLHENGTRERVFFISLADPSSPLDFHSSVTAYNLWRFREDNQMVDSKTFTPLTPEQTADWEYYFQLYRDIGYTGAEVSAKAWKDLCSKYPELAPGS